MNKRNARILSTGMYAPERVVPNHFFNELLGIDVATWLEENLTIRERRWCAEDESTADLVEHAAAEALKNAGVKPEQVDLLIVSTDTPEYISPSTASVVQHRMGLTNAGTFDVNTACAGFVTALDMGAKYIQADERYKHVLVVGAYAMSKYLNMADKKTVNLFADGAGAVVLESNSEGKGWLASELHTEGQYAGWMGIYAGGTAKSLDKEVLDNSEHLLTFVKKFPTEINPIQWSKMIRSSLGRIGKKPADVDQYFFTQININGIRETLEKLNEPMEKAHTIMDRYAYTGSACIPMALAEANARGKLNPGNLVVFMGSGGGLAFACAVFEW